MFDPVRDLRRYSSYINAEIGGVDPMQYAWMHPKMQSLMNTVFFSWNWTRGAWEAGGGTLIEKVLFGGHDVTPEETVYVGDSDVDVLTARNAGVTCCAVSWGFRSVDSLRAAGAERIADSPAQLLAMLEAL